MGQKFREENPLLINHQAGCQALYLCDPIDPHDKSCEEVVVNALFT